MDKIPCSVNDLRRNEAQVELNVYWHLEMLSFHVH